MTPTPSSPKARCIRKPRYDTRNAGALGREIPITEEIESHGGVLTWCGRTFLPSADDFVFVDLDAVLDESFDRDPRSVCPSCIRVALRRVAAMFGVRHDPRALIAIDPSALQDTRGRVALEEVDPRYDVIFFGPPRHDAR